MMMNKEPKVTLLSWTNDPLETVYSVWMASKDDMPLMTTEDVKKNVSSEEVEKLFKAVIAQRIPVGEHIDFIFLVENVSISWREQAVRHRIGTLISPERLGVDIVPDQHTSSWWSQSHRIRNVGSFADNGEYRLPATVSDISKTDDAAEAQDIFRDTMEEIQTAYNKLIKMGVPMEDARELLPLGAHHRISWKLNIGSLQHILGKRGCISGDTKIPLMSGVEKTMKELYEENGRDETFWVYSCDENGNVVPGKARSNGVTQIEAEVLEVELDNGEVVKATPDHRFMLRDGSYKRADELGVGQSLMPIYRRVSDGKSSITRDRMEGYEEIYNPGTDNWKFTHRLACRDGDGTVIHHRDFDKRNNEPDNLVFMDWREHIKLHSFETKAISSAEQSRRAKLASRNVRVKAGRIAAEKGVLKRNCELAAQANRNNAVRGKKISESLKETLSDPKRRERMSDATKSQWLLPGMKDKMSRTISSAMKGRNHKVVAIRKSKTKMDVYDLSVDKHHNYATSAGVFIHNCWILQLGIWGPVIMGMIDELVTKVHPIFADLVKPPCIGDDDNFKECVYMEECQRRLDGDDELPPCPLHLCKHHFDKAVYEGDITVDTENYLELPMKETMVERTEQYRKFWRRDPYTGEKTK